EDMSEVENIGNWAPHLVEKLLPDGMGRPIKKYADIHLNIHHHPNGKAEVVRPSVGLFFAKRPVLVPVHDTGLVALSMTIPSGKLARFETHAVLPTGVRLYDVR